ncbi:MAG: selenium metabolism-associated LysR family transcriptional regulator [Andreesenia angusta]|nr:selenium metabolism-associated LysR family transcriptional regulator [Andreesenia angusta]
MEFRQLESFVKVVNLKSFSKAAQELYLTQPTVTSHIQSLEEELETLLINRYGKKATPTEAGEILYQYATNIIQVKDMAKFDLSAYNGKIQGELIISSSSVPRNYLLPEIIKDFSDEYPDISFIINERDSAKVVKDIKDGYADFGIVGAKYNEKYDDRYIDYIEIIEDRLCVITPNNSDFPWENNSYIDKEELFKHRMILREKGSGTRKLIEENLILEGEKAVDKDVFDKTSYIEDGEAIKKFVEIGLGVSIVSELTVEHEIERGSIKKFYLKDIDLNRSFYFAYHNKRELSPIQKRFRDYILKTV